MLDRTEGVVGFFGASSMERLPTEVAMTENMRRFKALATPRGASDAIQADRPRRPATMTFDWGVDQAARRGDNTDAPT